MRAIRLTAEQMKNDDGREYNPYVWERNVDSMMKYGNVEFFKVAKGDGYEYDRHFVVYTLPEGLRLMNTFGYSSCLSSAGFREARIASIYIDGDGNIERLPEGEVNIEISGILGEDGERVSLNNSREARDWMRNYSKRLGLVWTKC